MKSNLLRPGCRGTAISSWRQWFAVAAILAGLSACGGGSGGDIDETPDYAADATIVVPGPVKGRVAITGAVSGATVTLQTHDGQVIEGSAVTDGEGRFEAPVAQARRGLRVVATGGALPDGTRVGTLSSYVQPFSADGFGTEVSAVSTLHDRLRLAAHMSGTDAESRLTAYLNLQPGRSPQASFLRTNDFNSAVFMRALSESGLEFDAFFDSIVADVMASDESQRSFRGGLQVTPAASVIGMQLINGAVSHVGGTAMGKILSGIGMGSGDHAEVMARLNLIEDKLDEVAKAMTDVMAGIADLKVDIRQQSLGTHINLTMDVMDDLRYLDSYPVGERAQAQQDIEKKIIRLEADYTMIARVMDGKLGTSSLIQAFAETLKVNQRFYSAQHRQRLVDFVEFLDAINIQSYYLIIERYRALEARGEGSHQGKINQLADQLAQGRNSYLKRIPPALPHANAFIHLDDSRMWYSARTYNTRYEQWPALPPAVAAKGGWRVPDETAARRAFNQTERKKINGNAFAVKQGAPNSLFGLGNHKFWTTTCRTFSHEKNCQVFNPTDDDTMRIVVWTATPKIGAIFGRTEYGPPKPTDATAYYMVFRPMERPEMVMYLPWLYGSK